MKGRLEAWRAQGYDFNLDWLLRSVNTVLTGEAKFSFLDTQSPEDIKHGLQHATKHIETCLNLIGGRLGLDHARVFFGRFAIPVMVRYLETRGGTLSATESDKLLFWFAQTGMWGRYSGSTETYLDRDLECLERPDGGLDALLEELRLWHGGLRIEPGHFGGWSLGARFYPVLYMLTRMGEGRDLLKGFPLKSGMLGKMSSLEVHHIFPKAQLYRRDHTRSAVNAIANFCLLTKETNLAISDRLPEDYFYEAENKHPGALASHWIPMDERLWRIDRYEEFLEARRELLAEEANRRFGQLLHGEAHWLSENQRHSSDMRKPVNSGIASVEEEEALLDLSVWVAELGFKPGTLSYDYADPATGDQMAVFDLVWENGLQEGLTEPVAVLLNETTETVSLANAAGFRCFVSVEAFKAYVSNDLLGASGIAAE